MLGFRVETTFIDTQSSKQRHSYLSPVLGQAENNGEKLMQPKLTQKGGEVGMNANFSTGERMSPSTSKMPSS